MLIVVFCFRVVPELVASLRVWSLCGTVRGVYLITVRELRRLLKWKYALTEHLALRFFCRVGIWLGNWALILALKMCCENVDVAAILRCEYLWLTIVLSFFLVKKYGVAMSGTMWSGGLEEF